MSPLDATGRLAALAWVCVVFPLGRLAHLAGIWKRRVADSEGAPRPQVFSRAELGTPGPPRRRRS